MFEGFATHTVAVGPERIHLRSAGQGAPVLLLHGYPQTLAAWHLVAPLLAGDFTVVVPDLPGYGDSLGPGPDPEHRGHSKRRMAEVMVAVMASLGHHRFHVAGHDRGGRVGYRMALDRPACVASFAAVDIVPTVEQWDRVTMQSMLAGYHWAFLAQPAPMPERLIGGDPAFYVHHLLDRWAGRPGALHAEAVAAYERSIARPSVIEAHCEDYRAGAGIDADLDRADREAGRRLACPVLALWGTRYLRISPKPVWQTWANDVTEVALDCGHFIAEEEPSACAAALKAFFLAHPA